MRQSAAEFPRSLQARRAFEFLRERLVTGVHQPGDMLPVDALAAEIGVSRQTVLESMRALAATGLVTVVPQVGCRVTVHPKERIHDFFLMFARIEGLLAALAANRHVASELRRLRSIGSEIAALSNLRAGSRQRGEQHRLLNHEFHGYIHQMSRAPEIARLSQSFWDRSDFHIASIPQSPIYANRLEIAEHEHDEVIDCLARRDADEAEKLMRDHVFGFGMEILQRLSDLEKPKAVNGARSRDGARKA